MIKALLTIIKKPSTTEWETFRQFFGMNGALQEGQLVRC